MTTTAIDHPKLLADIDAAIGTATKADVGFLETLILDRLDDGRLTMKTTHRLLLQLRRRETAASPGLMSGRARHCETTCGPVYVEGQDDTTPRKGHHDDDHRTARQAARRHHEQADADATPDP